MGRILVIAPHMDDEVLGCGGTIVTHVEQGEIVDVCIVCNRAYERSYDAAAIETEKSCARQAQQVLGYTALHFLDLPDEQLASHLQPLLEALGRLVQDIRPHTVYTCHAGDVHQDHRTVAHASNIVLRAVATPFLSRVLAYEVPSATEQTFAGTAEAFLPNVFVEITGQLDRKLAAMAAYGRESRAFPHPRSPEMLRAKAHVRGAQCMRPAAEAYVLLREVVR